MLFPYRRKALFELTPFRNAKIAGVPTMAVVGAVNFVVFLILAGFCLEYPSLSGPTGASALIFMGAVFVVGALIFLVPGSTTNARAYQSTSHSKRSHQSNPILQQNAPNCSGNPAHSHPSASASATMNGQRTETAASNPQPAQQRRRTQICPTRGLRPSSSPNCIGVMIYRAIFVAV